ncbi:ankyrin repeat-containing domain protein [Aspergillus cavernicola]|uniref:Ankyrin repeat-containing domain protein n=1 Tax=Aspergillus cavernicola TaxID=176166 RepID=A0ABR4HYL6_9EURO
MSNPLMHKRWLTMARSQRQRQFETILADRQERAIKEAHVRETGEALRDPLIGQMSSGCYEDLPLTNPSDLSFVPDKPSFIGPPPSYFDAFESGCRKGPIATVQSIINSEACTPTPAFLHHGLCLALRAGNVEVARYLLAKGAPVVRKTPGNILSAPVDQQISLFELLADHGWTPNTPNFYGAVLLPSVLTNHNLLRWFLVHGANPNLGQQQGYRYGGSSADSCTSLENAARQGNVEAVRMLLDAGAVIQNGFPLHAAAAALPPGANPHVGLVSPSKDFDTSRIPVMALLVEHGADINHHQGPQTGNLMPGYPINEAVMAGAVERVRWLLEHGADPTKKGPWGTNMDKTAEDLYCRDQIPLSTGRHSSQRHRIITRTVTFLGIVSCLLLTLHWLPITFPSFKLFSCRYHAQSATHEPSFDDVGRVPFEAHIMSKCPDARDCIRELVVPTMEQVSDKVDFELSFIASVSNKSSDVECMHGPGECIGNMLMLCAANLPFPLEGSTARTPTVRYLGFATCLISSYTDIPDRTLVEQCALEHGIEFDALNECVSKQDDDPNKGPQGEHPLSGVSLLRNSARHSAELGVRTSCTVRLDDTVWCVRDGGVWKDCAEEGNGSQVSVLVEEIKRLWRQRN